MRLLNRMVVIAILLLTITNTIPLQNTLKILKITLEKTQILYERTKIALSILNILKVIVKENLVLLKWQQVKLLRLPEEKRMKYWKD